MIYSIPVSTMPKPCIFGRTNENPPWRHSGRSCPYNQFVLVLSGECHCCLDGREYRLSRGDLLFIPAELFYTFSTQTHCEYFFICFFGSYHKSDRMELEEYAARNAQTTQKNLYLSELTERWVYVAEKTKLSEMECSKLLSLLTRCQKLYASEKCLDRMMIDVLFGELLLTVGQFVAERDGQRKSSLSVDRIKAYISQNYTQALTVELLAREFEISKEHLCSRLKKDLGMTVSEYVHSVKLGHATELLLNSSMNISQIADYLGYSSPYYFSRMFKKHYSVSPTQYVRVNKNI